MDREVPMRSLCTPKILACAVLLVLVRAPGTAAQEGAFGIGGRFAWIRGDAHADTSAVRFTGGHIRLHMSKRTAVELSLDSKTDTSTDSTVRTRDFPVQASLLLYPLKSALSPYLLGGGGWYTHRIEQLADKEVVSSATTREFGWHAGFGAQMRLGGHAGMHADYRYTFLDFGSDNAGPSASLAGRSSLLSAPAKLLPSYRGSMWTAGLTVYF
jgi:opacity protein-like surface antigen